jgi:hypothetical protein
MKKPVLIVIDMLYDFLDNWGPGRKETLLQSINELVATRSFPHPSSGFDKNSRLVCEMPFRR